LPVDEWRETGSCRKARTKATTCPVPGQAVNACGSARCGGRTPACSTNVRLYCP